LALPHAGRREVHRVCLLVVGLERLGVVSCVELLALGVHWHVLECSMWSGLISGR
jgi:hypothetical protein